MATWPDWTQAPLGSNANSNHPPTAIPRLGNSAQGYLLGSVWLNHDLCLFSLLAREAAAQACTRSPPASGHPILSTKPTGISNVLNEALSGAKGEGKASPTQFQTPLVEPTYGTSEASQPWLLSRIT